MPITYRDREVQYRKRLFAVLPFAVIAVICLFISSDIVPDKVIDKTFGWQGAFQVLPDITIIPDNDPFESFPRERQLRVMTSIDLDVVDENAEGEALAKDTNPHEEELEVDIPPEDGLAPVRTFEAHSAVPYSEDYVILEMSKPEYPIRELLAGIEGEVTVELLINEQGHVERAWILSAYGPKSFEGSTLKAVKKYRFKPMMHNGLPITMWIRFRIMFRIFD
jgi:TonB family protein